MMFEASYYRKYPDSPSNQLIDALLNASRRGLKVEVILDISMKSDRTNTRNLETGKILKKGGVEVFFDPKNITTHTKLLIIDESIVVLGSTNWTYNALTKNHEVSTEIHSAAIAQKLKEYFQKVKDTGEKL
jgi:cardiolipin synthase